MFCAQCGQWLAEGDASCPRCGSPAHGTAIGPLTAAPAVAAPEPPPVRYAGFWRRFATMIVDGLVLFFPTAVVRVTLGGDAWGMGRWDDPGALRASFINVLLWWGYCAALESSPWQGTLGQQLLGIRVCDDRLRRISFGRATGRYAAQWVSALTCGIGYLVNLWTRRRQTLHDLASGCVLARAESLPATAPSPGGQP